MEQKEQIERAFEHKLSWERLDDKQATRVGIVGIYLTGSIYDSVGDLKLVEDWMVNNLLKFKKIVNPMVG